MKAIFFKLNGCLLIALLITSSTFADDLKIGAASVKVTPPIGTPMAGYYYARGVEKIHDDLYAKALVIEKDGIKIAIVECDFVSISAYIVDKIRKLVDKATGINAAYVMIGATHSYTGPIIPAEPASTNIGIDPKSKGAQVLAGYIEKLPALIAESIIQANAALKPANISFGLGHEGSISFNRRYFMTDGTVGWNPGLHNPKVVKPAGPIDPAVSVLYAETLDGRPISTFVNFALHLDEVGGSDVSADLPFTLSSKLGKIKGSDMVTIFSQGCSGNINHIDVNGDAPQSGNFRAEKNGTILAGEVIKTYPRLSDLNIKSIIVKSEIVPLPLAEISKDELAWARETSAKFGKRDAAPFLDFVKAFKILLVEERKGKPIQSEIQVFALGDSCAIVSFPNEIFTELGQYLKSRSPYAHTIITELTNGSNGYIPDRKAYDEGNYEPTSTRAAPGSGEILVENALRMLNELKNK
jgi:neutral ceramidase